ncbi:MAG: DUF4381 domain-containing protein [Thermomonas sp.]
MMVPLPLKDVHPGIAPSWWPPAPGWWILATLVLIVAFAVARWWLHRRRRDDAILQLFDDTLDQASTPSQQVAAMSALLRRSARLRDPAADRLEGDTWLQFLDDGLPERPFSNGAGSLLLDGGFRADVVEDDVALLRALVRQRYLTWMQRK